MDSHKILVSIIIPTYNSGSTIVATLESVFAQTFADYEVLVVDDGSTDGTEELLKPYILSNKIQYMYQENRGCGAARNNALKKALGKYTAFLDSDDLWHTDKLQLQVAALEAHPDCIVCSTENAVFEDESLISEIKRTSLDRPRSGHVLWHFIFHNIITLSSAMVRTDVLAKAGGFTEEYGIMMFADYDLWLRLAAMGKFCIVEKVLTYYRIRPPLSAREKIENYQKITSVFKNNMSHSSAKNKPLYALGLVINKAKGALAYPIHTVKKLGVKKIYKELKRRLLLRVDFLFYPYLLNKLEHSSLATVDQMCDFSYRHSFNLLIPGQIESEIRSFLDIAIKAQPRNVLEVGTAHGGNLFLLTKIARDNAKVISIDLPGGDFGGGYFSRKQMVYKKFATKNQKVFLIRGDSHDKKTLAEAQEILGQETIDLLFIDADHTYEGVKSDFEMYSALLQPGSIVGFHDIANSPEANYGVQKYWNEIKTKYRHQEIIADPDQKGYGIGVLFI